MLAPIVYAPPTPQQQVANANAHAYVAIQGRMSSHRSSQVGPRMTQHEPAQPPGGWTNYFGVQGVEGSLLQPVPPVTIKDLMDNNKQTFMIKMGTGVNIKESLKGHVVAVSVDGMGRANRLKPIIDMLNFEENDLVLVEGFEKNCAEWVSYGIPKANCLPMDTENPEIAQKILKTEGDLATQIITTAEAIYDNLPDSFFDRYGYKFGLYGLHLDKLLEFIEHAQPFVIDEMKASINRKVELMEEAGNNFNAAKADAAKARQKNQAEKAAFYKSTDRTVIMILAPENLIEIAPKLYKQNDVAAIDRNALRKLPKSLPNPTGERTEL